MNRHNARGHRLRVPIALGIAATSLTATLLTSGPAHAASTILDNAPLSYGFEGLAQPLRLVDTRPGQLGVLEQPGGSVGSDAGTALAPNTTVRYVVTPVAAIPAAPAAMTLNVTAVGATSGGYLTVFPCTSAATPAPATSTLNFGTAAIANSGLFTPAAGGICVRASKQVHVILDTTGYFSDGITALPEPKRLVDTRPGQLGVLEQPGGTVGSDIATPMQPNVPRRFVVADTAGLPPIVGALALNLTVVSPTAGGFMKAYPCSTVGAAQPATSTINFTTATVANGAVVATADNGGLCLVSSVAANAIVDVSAFTPYGMLAYGPARIVDTRPGQLGTDEQPTGAIGSDVSARLTPGVPTRFPIEAPGLFGGNPVALNITAVSPPAPGYLKVYGCETTAQPQPATSTANFTTANAANGTIVLPLSNTPSSKVGGRRTEEWTYSNGVCVVASQAIHVIIDVAGTFGVRPLDPFITEDLAPTGLSGPFLGVEDVSASGRWAVGVMHSAGVNGDGFHDWYFVRLDRLNGTSTVSPQAFDHCFAGSCEGTIRVGIDNNGTAYQEARNTAAYWTTTGSVATAPICDLPLSAEVITVQTDTFYEGRCRLSDNQTWGPPPIGTTSDNGRFFFNVDGDLVDATTGTARVLPPDWGFTVAPGCYESIGVADDGRVTQLVSCGSTGSLAMLNMDDSADFVPAAFTYTVTSSIAFAPNGNGVQVDDQWIDTRTAEVVTVAACAQVGGYTVWANSRSCSV